MILRGIDESLVRYWYADGHAGRLSALAVELYLVSPGAMVIVTIGGISIKAVHDAAPNVPIQAAS